MSLFPVFDVPQAASEQKKKCGVSPLFDFEKGDFVLNGANSPVYGSEHDAWVLWCVKTILTQRWACLGYGGNAGIEAEEAFMEPDRAAAESTFERTVTEALLADPLGRTRYVRQFSFEWLADSLRISCVAAALNGDAALISVNKSF